MNLVMSPLMMAQLPAANKIAKAAIRPMDAWHRNKRFLRASKRALY